MQREASERSQLDLFEGRPRRPVVLSYGGGLDGFTILLDALARGERPDQVVFCDVADGTLDRDGEDPGEWPGTYRHMREIVAPLCRREGIEFIWLDTATYPVRDARSLFAWLEARRQIPVAGPQRVCTVVAKVERFERWMDARYPDQDVEVWIGFEAGEEARAAKDPNAGARRRKPRPGAARRHNRFPLIERGLCRCLSEELVRAAGYPVPRKSACTFCPYGTKGDWQTLARELPDAFERTAKLEADKPPTSKGRKLSIMGYRTQKDAEGNVLGYKAPPLPEFIKGTYRRRQDRCEVCGQVRASKEAGVGYLDDPREAA